jgi:hypothetical protein
LFASSNLQNLSLRGGKAKAIQSAKTEAFVRPSRPTFALKASEKLRRFAVIIPFLVGFKTGPQAVDLS